jgi:hypothetical protein
MQNMWPESFSENDKVAAKNLLEEQAKLLPKLTNGVVYAEVTELETLDAMTNSMSNDFAFRFDILGKFLSKYRFNVLMFSHDITLYPVKFRVDEKIGLELGMKPTLSRGVFASIDTPELLQDFVAKVLTTERLKAVVGSIIRLSK